MATQNPNVTYEWRFLEIYAEDCIFQGIGRHILEDCKSPIYFQLYHQVLLFMKVFYEGILGSL